MRPRIVIGLVAAVALTACADGDPYDDEAENRPDLMVIDPPQARPGEVVELTYPRSTSRGVAFTLERADGDDWVWTHFLTAGVDGYSDGQPRWGDRGDEYGWDDIGNDGPGPDRILIPPNAELGPHRICTANAGDNFCAPIDITG